jgi:hypothetical protein
MESSWEAYPRGLIKGRRPGETQTNINLCKMRAVNFLSSVVFFLLIFPVKKVHNGISINRVILHFDGILNVTHSAHWPTLHTGKFDDIAIAIHCH